MTRRSLVGTYILLAGLLQVSLYLAMTVSSQLDWLFYFDPRIGLYFLETILRGAEHAPPAMLDWLSAIVQIGLGVSLLLKKIPVKLYVISELVLSAPSLLFFALVVWGNLSPAHGFSIGELIVPIIVFVLFSAVPLLLTLRKRSQAPLTIR